MATPAAPTTPQAPVWPLTARARLIPTTQAAVLTPCESCHRCPASFTISWSDAEFWVCSACALPAAGPAAVAIEPRGGRPVADHDQRRLSQSARRAARRGRPGPPGAAAAPAGSVTPAPGVPGLPAVTVEDEVDVLRTAARTLLTSRPSPRGRRLGRDGGCDVVAALVLAAGGVVDQSGRPVPSSERPAAQLLRRVLQRVADQLAQCAPGRSWNGDPVALIDAWQAHVALPGAARAAVLTAAAGLASGCCPLSGAARGATSGGSGDQPGGTESGPCPAGPAALPAVGARG